MRQEIGRRAVETSASQLGILTGVERKLVFNRLRAWVGSRWELPRLLEGLHVPPNSLGLEIGAGLGWGASGLLQRYDSLRIIASDYDGTILPAARAYLQHHGRASQAGFVQADTRCTPFPDQAFDLTLALYVFHHVTGYAQALGEIGRITKPGGYLLFIDLLRAATVPGFRRWLAPDSLPSRLELSRYLAAAGFEVARWRGLPFWAFVAARKAQPPLQHDGAQSHA